MLVRGLCAVIAAIALAGCVSTPDELRNKTPAGALDIHPTVTRERFEACFERALSERLLFGIDNLGLIYRQKPLDDGGVEIMAFATIMGTVPVLVWTITPPSGGVVHITQRTARNLMRPPEWVWPRVRASAAACGDVVRDEPPV